MKTDPSEKVTTRLIKWLAADQAVPPEKASLADEEMIPAAADAALRGEDIRQKYPLFWRSLLADAELRAAFLQVVSALETPADDEITLPHPSWLAEVLNRTSPLPTVGQYSRERWLIQWRATVGRLNYLLSGEADRVYRRAVNMLSEQTVTLLRTVVTFESGALEALLQIQRSSVLPTYTVQLLVVYEPAPFISAAPDLEARLTWGDYWARAPLVEGEAVFPPVPVASVTEGETGRVIYELDLQIAPILSS